MTKAHDELVSIAKDIDSKHLRIIQRHQRTQLMLAKRNHDRGMAHFFAVRVKAVSEVLDSRKQVSS